jgi:hypothetical protein
MEHEMTMPTTFIKMNGTWYQRIPSEIIEHTGLDKAESPVDGLIRTETNKNKKTFYSSWIKGT